MGLSEPSSDDTADQVEGGNIGDLGFYKVPGSRKEGSRGLSWQAQGGRVQWRGETEIHIIQIDYAVNIRGLPFVARFQQQVSFF